MNDIKDRELLAFSNATNLEWQFMIDTDEKKGAKLNALLTPESFVRKDSENVDEVEYIYCNTKLSENENLTPEQIEQGLEKMQNSAGVLMNYLEECDKNSNEGNFLKDWEVVYGADNYKVVADYLDIQKKIFEEKLSEELSKQELDKVLEIFSYKSREEVEGKASIKKKVDFAVKLVSNVTEALGFYFNFSIEINGEKIIKKISEELSKSILEELIKKTNCVPAVALYNCLSGGNMKNISLGSEIGGKAVKEINKTNLDLSLLDDTNVRLTHELEMANTGFKTVAFRKEGKIVIAFKNEKIKNRELLPSEIDYLNIVYNSIRKEYPNEEIIFTGYEGGGDLSVLSLFLSEKSLATSFYSSKLEEFKGFINFTPEDFDKKYKSGLNIEVEGRLSQTIGKDVLKALLFSLIVRGAIKGFSQSLISGNIYAILSVIPFLVVKGFLDMNKDKEIKEQYEFLQGKELDFVSKKKGDIEGYIKEKFFETKFIYVNTKDGKSIKLEKDTYLYYKFGLDGKDIVNKKEITGDGKDSEHYLIYLSRNNDSLYNENGNDLDKNTSFEEKEYLILSKDEEGVFISSGILKDRTYHRGIDTRRTFIKELTEPKELLKFRMLCSVMFVTGKLQRGYEKNIDKLSFLYVNGSKVDKIEGKGFPTGDIVPYGEENGYIPLNEYIFLPFIGTDGNIKDNIRQDYLKNAFKDIVRGTLGTNKKHNFHNDNVDEGIFELFEKDRNDKGIYIVNASNGRNRLDESSHIYFYNKIKEEILKDDLYKQFYTMEVGLVSENSLKKFGKMFWGTLGVDVDYTESPAVKKIKFEFKDGEMHYGFDNNSLLSREDYAFDVEGKLKYSGKTKGSSDFNGINSQDGLNKKEILENVDIELQV